MSNDGCQPHESVILGLGTGSTLVLKIGAECSNPARSDLCGGPGETSVPTATSLSPSSGRLIRRLPFHEADVLSLKTGNPAFFVRKDASLIQGLHPKLLQFDDGLIFAADLPAKIQS